jgi:hypothetical protein
MLVLFQSKSKEENCFDIVINTNKADLVAINFKIQKKVYFIKYAFDVLHGGEIKVNESYDTEAEARASIKTKLLQLGFSDSEATNISTDCCFVKEDENDKIDALKKLLC